jgi:PAS domain S-box-containing protein/excisionase family DNA binding protein
MSELMTTKEASEYLKLSYMTLYKLAQQGEIPAYKLGGHWRFNKTVLDSWFANKSQVLERNILLIGDDMDTLELNNLITTRENFKVTTVRNPERAYKELELVKYSIIFLISKPDTVTNADVISEIRTRDKKAIIVISTRQGDDPIAIDALAAGPLFIIQKPFQENAMLKILHSLDSQSTSQEAKAKDQLMSELTDLRQRIDHLAKSDNARNKTEESLYQAEEKLRRIMESSNDIFLLLDANFNILEANKAAARYLPVGTSKKDYLGKNILSVMPIIKKSGRYEQYLEVLRTGKPVELNDVVIDPAFGEARFSVRIFKVGDGLGIMATDITELKLMEAVKESEEFSSNLLDNAPYPILVAEPNTAIKYANPALEKLTGYSLSELLGKKVPYPYWTEEATKRMIEHTGQALLDSVQKLELPMEKKSGKLFWVEVTTKIVMKNDKLSCYLSIWVDITKRKKADEALLEEKNFSEATINSLPGVFYLIDTKGNFFKWNKNLETETEYSAKELSKMNALNLFSKKDRALIQQKIETVFSNGKDSVEVNAVAKSGRIVPYHLTGSRVTLNDKIYLAGVGIEISERKKMEEEVRAGEENLKAFLENAPDAMFVHDIEGKILGLNKKAEQLFDIKSKDYIGKSILDIGLVGEERLPTIIDGLKEIKKGKANKPVEVELTNKKGSRVVVEVTGFPITKNGQTQVCDIIRDITKLKRANKAPAKKTRK